MNTQQYLKLVGNVMAKGQPQSAHKLGSVQSLLQLVSHGQTNLSASCLLMSTASLVWPDQFSASHLSMFHIDNIFMVSSPHLTLQMFAPF